MWLVQTSSYQNLSMNALILSHVSYEIGLIGIKKKFYRVIKFKNFDVSIKLLLWGSQNQATYILKERTLWNRWGSGMGISIRMFFFTFLKKQLKSLNNERKLTNFGYVFVTRFSGRLI